MKRFLLIGAILAGAFGIGANPAAATAYPWGDVNCSGAVTSTDINVVVYMAAGGSNPFPGCTQTADLNCSGAVTSTDISIILYIAAGGVYSPPGTC